MGFGEESEEKKQPSILYPRIWTHFMLLKLSFVLFCLLTLRFSQAQEKFDPAIVAEASSRLTNVSFFCAHPHSHFFQKKNSPIERKGVAKHDNSSNAANWCGFQGHSISSWKRFTFISRVLTVAAFQMASCSSLTIRKIIIFLHQMLLFLFVFYSNNCIPSFF